MPDWGVGISGELLLLERALKRWLQPQDQGWSRVVQALAQLQGPWGRQPDSRLQKGGQTPLLAELCRVEDWKNRRRSENGSPEREK